MSVVVIAAFYSGYAGRRIRALNEHQCDVQCVAAHIWLPFPLSYFRDLASAAKLDKLGHIGGARIAPLRLGLGCSV